MMTRPSHKMLAIVYTGYCSGNQVQAVSVIAASEAESNSPVARAAKDVELV